MNTDKTADVLETQLLYTQMLDAVKHTIYLGVGRYNFKGGVFRGIIQVDTEPLVSLQILINSLFLTEDEKNKIGLIRQILICFSMMDVSHMPRALFMQLREKILFEKGLQSIFEADAKENAPPTVIEGVDARTGEVQWTQVVDKKVNIRIIPGAKIGEAGKVVKLANKGPGPRLGSDTISDAEAQLWAEAQASGMVTPGGTVEEGLGAFPLRAANSAEIAKALGAITPGGTYGGAAPMTPGGTFKLGGLGTGDGSMGLNVPRSPVSSRSSTTSLRKWTLLSQADHIMDEERSPLVGDPDRGLYPLTSEKDLVLH